MLEVYMMKAIKQAEYAYKNREVPVGAVVFDKQGSLIGKGYNQVEMLKDATAHAEMIAITSAMAKLGSKYLHGCTLAVTMEPCPMCAGAIGVSKLDRLIFGAYDMKLGAAGTRFNLIGSKSLCSNIESLGGIKQDICSSMLKDFFAQIRKDI